MSKAKKVTKKSADVVIPNLDIVDPLDKNGSKQNFLTDESYGADFKEYAKKWSVLPLYENKEEMKNMFESIHNNQVTLVISGTGSGKTVLVPKFLLKYFWATKSEDKRKETKIVITNPKTLTTIYNAEYSAKTLDVELGSHVGFQFRGSPSNMVSDKSKLIYSTDGLVLAKITKGDTMLKEYDGVIIDEAHERQVPIDLLLYFLKNVMKNRPEFKVIIMSATIDSEVFRKFYEEDGIKYGKVEVSGKSNYPITSIFMEPNNKINLFTYMDVGIAQVLKLLETTETGDILMFVTSQRETEVGCSKLKKLCPGKVAITDVCDQYYCAEVFAKMPDDKRVVAVDKDKYRELSAKYKRKVIFATNVAESSITLDGIVYVIDSGLEFLGYFDFDRYASVLDKRYTTKAQIRQRMGRAGRTQPGTCYHLYTEDHFNRLTDFPSPAIALSNLNDHFLSFIKNRGYLSDAINLATSLITPASLKQITSAVRYLHFYNIIKIISVNKETNTGVPTASRSIKNNKDVVIGKIYGKTKANICPDTAIEYFLNKQFGGDPDEISVDESQSSDKDIVEEEETPNTLSFKEVPYKRLMIQDKRMTNVIKLYDNYEGTVTTFGNIMHALTGYPMELTMLAFYGRLLGLPSLYTIASTMAAMEGKIDNLINFPSNVGMKDKSSYVNENFPNAVTYHYSEHLFVYNLISNYFELDQNMDKLNKATYDRAQDIKATFSKVLDKVKDSTIDNINSKYKLIPPNIDVDSMELIDKIYLGIYLSHRFNTMKLLMVEGKTPLYQTKYYFDNTQGTPSFSYGNQLTPESANNYSTGICTNISYLVAKPIINGCTLFPDTFIEKLN